jgi:hypothetical protein
MTDDPKAIESFLAIVAKNEAQISTRRDIDVQHDIYELDEVARRAAEPGTDPAKTVRSYRSAAQSRVKERIKFYEQVLGLLGKARLGEGSL